MVKKENTNNKIVVKKVKGSKAEREEKKAKEKEKINLEQKEISKEKKIKYNHFLPTKHSQAKNIAKRLIEGKITDHTSAYKIILRKLIESIFYWNESPFILNKKKFEEVMKEYKKMLETISQVKEIIDFPVVEKRETKINIVGNTFGILFFIAKELFYHINGNQL